MREGRPNRNFVWSPSRGAGGRNKQRGCGPRDWAAGDTLLRVCRLLQMLCCVHRCLFITSLSSPSPPSHLYSSPSALPKSVRTQPQTPGNNHHSQHSPSSHPRPSSLPLQRLKPLLVGASSLLLSAFIHFTLWIHLAFHLPIKADKRKSLFPSRALGKSH